MEMVQRVSDVSSVDFLEWIEGMDYKIFLLDRNICQCLIVNSLSEMFAEWGSLGRFENLLFFAARKNIPAGYCNYVTVTLKVTVTSQS
jgi:hypothetical protein